MLWVDQEDQREAPRLVGWQLRIAHGAPEGRSAAKQKFGGRAIFKELTVSENLLFPVSPCQLMIAGQLSSSDVAY
ncbi:hypothetical protein HMPREF9238_00609 [Gleimia europaea ACS-120-V-Col10b]|uniref:Uncharacterized protein n=1 Tax=Gleimia europaea ACS-120-V-Col10b TaxID=883069 RepID=A0A9W5REB1_9ACTO|nr:hypothetical protein HMPREF9238_00609 [Gleimia europaea ACS-120-V-Col10b]